MQYLIPGSLVGAMVSLNLQVLNSTLGCLRRGWKGAERLVTSGLFSLFRPCKNVGAAPSFLVHKAKIKLSCEKR